MKFLEKILPNKIFNLLLSGSILLFLAILLSYFNFVLENNVHEEKIGNLSIPGSILISDLPNNIKNRSSFFLDTRIISSHARISKNPFKNNFFYEFDLEVEYKVRFKDQRTENNEFNLSSKNQILKNSMQKKVINGEEFYKIPLFSLSNLNEVDSLEIIFRNKTDMNFKTLSTFFDSELLVKEVSTFSLVYSLIIIILVFFGLLLFLYGFFLLILNFKKTKLDYLCL